MSRQSLSAGKTLHGVQAVLRHMDQLLDAEVVEESDVTVERISDLGDRVIVLERETYVGRASGVRTEARIGAIYRVVDGRIADVRGFMTHEEALEAAGCAGRSSGRPDHRGLRRNPGATGPRMSW